MCLSSSGNHAENSDQDLSHLIINRLNLTEMRHLNRPNFVWQKDYVLIIFRQHFGTLEVTMWLYRNFPKLLPGSNFLNQNVFGNF